MNRPKDGKVWVVLADAGDLKMNTEIQLPPGALIAGDHGVIEVQTTNGRVSAFVKQMTKSIGSKLKRTLNGQNYKLV